MHFFTFGLCLIMAIYCDVVQSDQVLYAVNYGGEEQAGSAGIWYRADTAPHQKVYTPAYIIGASDNDQSIYRTTFNGSELIADLPLDGNGSYTLILKFVESSTGSTTNVIINKKHQILSAFNVYSLVGGRTAYDKHITFSVLNNQLTWENEVSDIVDGKIQFKVTGNGAQLAAVVWKKNDARQTKL
jgi:hypothetical protein